MPKLTHPEYAALEPLARKRVEKLAALLRVADGLDARHLGLVNDVSVRRDAGRIIIGAQAEADISSEVGAAMLKADLFERVFDLRVTIEPLLAEIRV
jgi:exopolyphosphatase/guanosine-5'-triphosphate,3'-diphosphate pyrophosphatase